MDHQPQFPELPPEITNQKEPEPYPVRFSVEYPAKQSRLLAVLSLPFFLIRIILLIPTFIVLYVLGLVMIITAWLGIWMILFTGHNSESLFKFNAGVIGWKARFSAYAYGLTDKYPPFRLEP
ncbi:hypothetical protein BVY00_01555 [bacterium G20]|nr:hypothetical protein BVY00_01555 [bacterium G20]